jgi:hypothetical protein|tara:strand:- start:516 stop:1187 length:672 start_codon:yes stop_codon:yes gene_type:complete
MNFLKNKFGIDLAMLEHRNWTIRIVSTILWILAISIMSEKFDDRNYELTDLDSMINFYIFVYMLGMFIWGSVNFNKILVNAPIPKPENSIHFDLHERANWLLDQTENYSGTEHHLDELNYLKDKYKSELKDFDASRKILTKQRKENYESNKRVNNVRFKGPKSNSIVCPHCQTKGDVHKSRKEVVEESREKGIIGATIGRKTITNKGSITELYCANCDTTWQV